MRAQSDRAIEKYRASRQRQRKRYCLSPQQHETAERDERKREGPSLALPCLPPLPIALHLSFSLPRDTYTPPHFLQEPRPTTDDDVARGVHLNPSTSHRPPDSEPHLSYLLSFIDSIHSPVSPRVSPLEKCPHTQERRQIFVEGRFSYLQRKFHRIQLIDDYF